MVRARRARRPRGFVIAAVVVLLLAALGLTRFYTDVLWFREVGLTSVLWTTLRTQFLLGLAVGLVIAGLVFANLLLARRLAPAYPTLRLEEGPPDPAARYRALVTPYLTALQVGVAVVVGIMAGLSAGAAWRLYLLWGHRTTFGVSDEQFGRDVGFYVFELPFYETALGWLWFGLMASLVLSAVAHYLHGSIGPGGGFARIRSGALAHLSVLLGALALVKAGQYWLGQFELNFSPRGQVTGASYTDVHAQLPALKLLVIISIISAALFLANIRVRRFSLPLAAVGIWVLTAFLAGGVWPWWVQRFSVAPQEPQREEPYIERNITATRAAFGLDDVESRTFSATPSIGPEEVTANEAMLQNVRLWDPGVLEVAYGQLQTLRPYYQFEDVDIDRYRVDGELRQVLLSARELDLSGLEERSQTWQNLHLQYTHGFGIVASLANASTVAGQPAFIVDDIPSVVAAGAEALGAEQARIYYGEGFEPREYSIVNSKQQEIDYPVEEGVARSTYEGEGGVAVGNFFTRLAFAIREGDPNLLLSNLITGESRILLYRNVRDRVLRAAPFLSLDNDPYPAVVDGRLVWILDAYTSTRWYPYSERIDAGEFVADDDGTLTGRVSYVRNSVKVVVDAYNGSMNFHVIDEDDPLIRAWRGVFPDLFEAPEPSPELREHFRYPEDLLALQSEVYRTYHMSNAFDFYSKEDEWQLPEGVSASGAPEGVVPPTYLLMRVPGSDEQEFVLTRPFTPRGRKNMVAFFIGRSDPDRYGELLTLQFPRQRTVLGPAQVDNIINQDVEFSRTRTLLGQEGSELSFGSLVILPIEDSLLYVQPLFVTAENLGIPELKRVVIVFGEQVVFAEDFDSALAELFGAAEPPPEEPEEPTEPGPPEEPAIAELVARAGRLYDAAQEALSNGDFETYGRLIERLGDVLGRLERLATGTSGR